MSFFCQSGVVKPTMFFAEAIGTVIVRETPGKVNCMHGITHVARHFSIFSMSHIFFASTYPLEKYEWNLMWSKSANKQGSRHWSCARQLLWNNSLPSPHHLQGSETAGLRGGAPVAPGLAAAGRSRAAHATALGQNGARTSRRRCGWSGMEETSGENGYRLVKSNGS